MDKKTESKINNIFPGPGIFIVDKDKANDVLLEIIETNINKESIPVNTTENPLLDNFNEKNSININNVYYINNYYNKKSNKKSGFSFLKYVLKILIPMVGHTLIKILLSFFKIDFDDDDDSHNYILSIA